MYDYAIARATNQPWVIDKPMLSVITNLLRFRAAGGRLTAEEIHARIGEPDGRRTVAESRESGTVAVIPILGVICHRGESFEASSGGTSTQRIGVYLARALASDSVKSIVLDIASPGGSVEGVPELADQIFAGRRVKPITAMVNADACSGAYWLASQASDIAITPSGRTGSIGVYALFVDESEYLAKEGIKVNAISAGECKLEGAPWQELSSASRAHFQAGVDRVYRLFKSHVARGRNVSVADVENEFGQGRAFEAQEARARRMVDRVATFDSELSRAGSASGRRALVTDSEAQRIADVDYTRAGVAIAEAQMRSR